MPVLLATHEGRYSILEADLSNGPEPIGVLLEDPARNELHLRLRRDWEDVAGEDAGIFERLEDDLADKSRELGTDRLFAWLEDTLSTTLRVTDREPVLVRDFEWTLNQLYTRHVRSTIAPGRTHVPRWSLQVAAGQFLDNAEVEEVDYEELPANVRRVTADLFAAEIVGTSMEPDIPNGSICLFRKFGAGTRNGKLVLVEELGRGNNDRYTVKRYVSTKRQRPDGTWDHNTIRLEPLNPDHEPWFLNPEEKRYRIVAEFVQVLR